jgi:hypothetical protein
MDLLEQLRDLRERHSPKYIYEKWDTISKLYETGRISEYDYKEIRDLVNSRLVELKRIKDQTD